MPEFRWPTTPATFASTSFCATVVPTFGSAWSSSLTIVNVTSLPSIVSFSALACCDGQRDAVLVVLAEVRDAAGERADVADGDGQAGVGRLRVGFRGRRFFFLPQAVDRKGGGDGEGQLERGIHGFS